MPCKVYRWDLPLSIGPLEANVRAIAAGEIDVAMFTSAHQVVNLLRVAEQLQLGGPLRRGIERAVVASIGPTTSETLHELELHVDIEPEHSKMGHLVAAAAEKAAADQPAEAGERRRVVCRGRGNQQRRPARFAAEARSGAGRPLGRRPVHAGLSLAAGRAHAHLADAAGRPLHGRVSRSPREDDASSNCARTRRCAPR